MAEDLTNNYYDRSTEFYEYGWGEKFHFAQLSPLESFKESLARHERFLALKLRNLNLSFFLYLIILIILNNSYHY